MSHLEREALIESRIEALDLAPQLLITPGGLYASAVQDGLTLYLSGQVPRVGDSVPYVGRVGDEVSLEEGTKAARLCVSRLLGAIKESLGSYARVRRLCKMTVFAQAASPSALSAVAEAASTALEEVFSPSGSHARTTIGVALLPRNAPVEIELIVAVEPGGTN